VPRALSDTLEELFETFDQMHDWEERYEYLIDLGDKLPDMPAEEKVEKNRVQGCQSNVWLVARTREATPPVLDFEADSDAQIVKGLVAILLQMLSGRTPEEILSFDIGHVFTRLGLKQHLSPLRSNGLHSMVKRIKMLAAGQSA